MIAANAGSVEAVKQLIARGADVNAAESRKGQTALMWAAAEGHPDVVQVLIDNKARRQRRVEERFHARWCSRRSRTIRNPCRSCWPPARIANFALPDGTKVLLVAASHKSALAAARAGGWRRGSECRGSEAEILRCTPPRSPATWNW